MKTMILSLVLLGACAEDPVIVGQEGEELTIADCIATGVYTDSGKSGPQTCPPLGTACTAGSLTRSSEQHCPAGDPDAGAACADPYQLSAHTAFRHGTFNANTGDYNAIPTDCGGHHPPICVFNAFPSSDEGAGAYNAAACYKKTFGSGGTAIYTHGLCDNIYSAGDHCSIGCTGSWGDSCTSCVYGPSSGNGEWYTVSAVVWADGLGAMYHSGNTAGASGCHST